MDNKPTELEKIIIDPEYRKELKEGMAYLGGHRLNPSLDKYISEGPSFKPYVSISQRIYARLYNLSVNTNKYFSFLY